MSDHTPAFENPYDFSLVGNRVAILAFLAAHDRHDGGGMGRSNYLAWNIKVNRRIDDTGHAGAEMANDDDVMVRERFDSAWAEHIADQDIFTDACEDAMRYIFDGEYTIWPGENVDAKFYRVGRSGGWLILDTLNGVRIRTDELDELSDETLDLLCKLVVSLDKDLAEPNRTNEVNYQIAWRRARWEEDEMIPAEDEAAAELESSRPDLYGTQPPA